MATEKPKSARERVMEDALAARKEVLEKEFKMTATGVMPEVEFEPAPPEENKAPVSGVQEAPAEAPTSDSSAHKSDDMSTPAEEAPEATAPVVEAPKLVTVKVDGQEFDVPQSEIDKAGSVALYQIERAAQNRLREINEKQHLLTQKLQELDKPREPVKNPDDGLRETVRAIQFGSEDEAMAAIRSLKQPAVTTPPVDQIVDMAAKRLEWDNAVKGFFKDNRDLLQDPDIQIIALARENELKQQIQQRGQWPSDIDKFYKDLGTSLRTKYGKPAGVDVKARQDKKEAIAEPNKVAGKIQPAPEIKPKTASEIIEEQRRARHQRSMA